MDIPFMLGTDSLKNQDTSTMIFPVKIEAINVRWRSTHVRSSVEWRVRTNTKPINLHLANNPNATKSSIKTCKMTPAAGHPAVDPCKSKGHASKANDSSEALVSTSSQTTNTSTPSSTNFPIFDPLIFISIMYHTHSPSSSIPFVLL